jgi:cyclopropane fatty-acyl-phospholipid synthase-like methyltransferase
MVDVYAQSTEADEAIQRRLAEVLELRAADEQQQAMLASYLDDVPMPAGGRVLEIGCGTGAVARAIASRPGRREVVGVAGWRVARVRSHGYVESSTASPSP